MMIFFFQNLQSQICQQFDQYDTVLLVGQLLQPTQRGAAYNFRQVRPPYYRRFSSFLFRKIKVRLRSYRSYLRHDVKAPDIETKLLKVWLVRIGKTEAKSFNVTQQHFSKQFELQKKFHPSSNHKIHLIQCFQTLLPTVHQIPIP